MKKTEQIVVAGGPYRALDPRRCKRRERLKKEIDRLSRVRYQRWRRLHDVDGPLFQLCVVATGGLAYIFFPSFVGVAVILIGLMTLLWYYRFALYLWFRWKQYGDPESLIKQKLDELANLPPE